MKAMGIVLHKVNTAAGHSVAKLIFHCSLNSPKTLNSHITNVHEMQAIPALVASLAFQASQISQT
jgi:hypothetical protein